MGFVVVVVCTVFALFGYQSNAGSVKSVDNLSFLVCFLEETVRLMLIL